MPALKPGFVGAEFEWASNCPWCLRVYDGMTCLHRERDATPVLAPRPGDVTVCLACHQPAVMSVNGTFRRPNPIEMAQLAADDLFVRARAASEAAEEMYGPYDPDDAPGNRHQRRAAARRR